METPIQSQTNTMPSSYNKKKRIIAIAILVLISLLGLILWYVLHKPSKAEQQPSPALPPLETLQALDAVSSPITATPKERALELKELSKNSKKVSATAADREKLLEKLNTVQ